MKRFIVDGVPRYAEDAAKTLYSQGRAGTTLEDLTQRLVDLDVDMAGTAGTLTFTRKAGPPRAQK